jgi:hypothetical protein
VTFANDSDKAFPSEADESNRDKNGDDASCLSQRSSTKRRNTESGRPKMFDTGVYIDFSPTLLASSSSSGVSDSQTPQALLKQLIRESMKKRQSKEPVPSDVELRHQISDACWNVYEGKEKGDAANL